MTNINQTLIDFAQAVIDGNADPLEAYIHLNQIEKHLKGAFECVEDLARKEADKWTEKTFTYKGAEITKKNGAGKYDYSNISLWKDAEKRKKEIELLAKTAYKSKATVVDEASGEVIDKPIYTQGNAVISVKLLG